MAVYFKFHSAKDYDTLPIEGSFISIGELKKNIIEKKLKGKLNKNGGLDFELVLINAQTKQQYEDNGAIIPKNTSVVVKRVPVIIGPKKISTIPPNISSPMPTPEPHKIFVPNIPGLDSDFGAHIIPAASPPLTQELSEDEKIAALVQGASAFGGPISNNKPGQTKFGAPPPGNYVCYRCGIAGHWIQHCPTNGDPHFKRNFGIPRSMQSQSSQPLMVPQPNEEPFKQFANKMKGSSIPSAKLTPAELQCPICKQVLRDAVIISCCGNSFCDECIRSVLVQERRYSCPSCKQQNVRPDQVVSNLQLRRAVVSFLASLAGNETPQSPIVHTPSSPTVPLEEQPRRRTPPPNSVSHKEHNVDVRKCFNCGEGGHIARNCKEARVPRFERSRTRTTGEKRKERDVIFKEREAKRYKRSELLVN